MKNLTLPEIYKWCEDKNLKLVGKGSSRIVYRYNDTQVIKVALNEKGISQNQEEYNNYDILLSFLPQIDVNESDLTNFKFLISEYVTPLKGRNEFQRLFDTDFHRYTIALQAAKQGEEYGGIKKEPFIDILHYVADKKPFLKDFLIPSSYGYIIEDGKPKLMLVDNGLNGDIFNKFYNKQ